MYLISSSKATILTDFENLENKCTYHHTNGENRDFSTCSSQHVFVEINHKSGLEILRIKRGNNQQCDLQRVRKLAINGVYCVACTKHSFGEIAVGLANGQVKLYNNRSTEPIHKFSSDSHDNSVLFLDYNASDDYIAGVFENGFINLYGLKTKTKLEAFNIDNQSTLARFHPCKRFHLSIASYKGSVTVYDIQAKCKIFNALEAHTAPCRDLCMAPATPDILITAGYDCLINIYDTRRKIQPTQLKFCHPLSTVAVNESGQYICVGNLKGELITYDMRNLNRFLMCKKVHDCAVTRIAFAYKGTDTASSGSNLYTSTEGLTAESLQSTGNSSADITRDGHLGKLLDNISGNSKSIATPLKHHDSFGDFLDFHANRGRENCSPRFIPTRESFDWEALNSKSVNNSSAIKLDLLQPDSTKFDTAELIDLKDSLRRDEIDAKLRLSENDKMQPLKDVSNVSMKSKLIYVKEKTQEKEEKQLENELGQFNIHRDCIVEDQNNKTKNTENLMQPIMHSQGQQSEKDIDMCNSQNISPSFGCISTPNNDRHEQYMHNNQVKLPASFKPSSPSICYISQSTSTANNTTTSVAMDKNVEEHMEKHNVIVMNAIKSLREEMLERFRQLEFELKFHMDRNKWQIFTQNFNLWQQQHNQSERLHEACNGPSQCDQFVNEFIRLQEENQLLKEQLKK